MLHGSVLGSSRIEIYSLGGIDWSELDTLITDLAPCPNYDEIEIIPKLFIVDEHAPPPLPSRSSNRPPPLPPKDYMTGNPTPVTNPLDMRGSNIVLLNEPPSHDTSSEDEMYAEFLNNNQKKTTIEDDTFEDIPI